MTTARYSNHEVSGLSPVGRPSNAGAFTGRTKSEAPRASIDWLVGAKKDQSQIEFGIAIFCFSKISSDDPRNFVGQLKGVRRREKSNYSAK
jgi:hypothetical protein